MSDNTDRLRKHVASYKSLSSHRQNCLDVCDEIERLQAECHKYHVNINGLQTELDDAKAELETTKKRADANGDHARLANENMGAIAKSLKVERAENERLREALEKAQGELINLQPHIPQACKPGHESFIDTYVDKALLVIEEALKGFESE